MLLVRGDLDKALEAADKAVLLSRAPYLPLGRRPQTADLPADEVEQRGAADGGVPPRPEVRGRGPSRAPCPDGACGRRGGELGSALALYGRAVVAAADSQASLRLSAERESLIDGVRTSPRSGAAEGEEDPEVRGHLYLAMGNAAIREGVPRDGGPRVRAIGAGRGKRSRGGRGAPVPGGEDHRRAAQDRRPRPLLTESSPTSGMRSSPGRKWPSARSTGSSGTALHRSSGGWTRRGSPRRRGRSSSPPRPTGWCSASSARSPEEGRSVGAAFTQKSPPTLYLGQKPILEKPFLYGFGLSPAQEARGPSRAPGAGGGFPTCSCSTRRTATERGSPPRPPRPPGRRGSGSRRPCRTPRRCRTSRRRSRGRSATRPSSASRDRRRRGRR